MSFKLHARILERHSSVFRGQLSGAQARDTHLEILEDCVVLRVEYKGPHLAEPFQVSVAAGEYSCSREFSIVLMESR